MSRIQNIEPIRTTAWVALLLLTLSACGDGAAMEVSFNPADRFPGLALEVQTQNGTRRFTKSDLEADGPEVSTGSFEVAEEGTLTLEVQVSSNDQTIAGGNVEIAARPDFRWNVDFFYATSDPADECLGCAGTSRIEVAETFRTEPGEALWVAWGGQPEGDRVVY